MNSTHNKATGLETNIDQNKTSKPLSDLNRIKNVFVSMHLLQMYGIDSS